MIQQHVTFFELDFDMYVYILSTGDRRGVCGEKFLFS